MFWQLRRGIGKNRGKVQLYIKQENKFFEDKYVQPKICPMCQNSLRWQTFCLTLLNKTLPHFPSAEVGRSSDHNYTTCSSLHYLECRMHISPAFEVKVTLGLKSTCTDGYVAKLKRQVKKKILWLQHSDYQLCFRGRKNYCLNSFVAK